MLSNRHRIAMIEALHYDWRTQQLDILEEDRGQASTVQGDRCGNQWDTFHLAYIMH